jgi:hypothetical protein
MSPLNIEVLYCRLFGYNIYVSVYEREIHALCTFEFNHIDGGRGSAPEKTKAY